MKTALEYALQAYSAKEVPVGAIVVAENKIIGVGYNQREAQHDPTAHAEVLAIREAAFFTQRWRLSDATLYVTQEPCMMCAGAILNARIARLVFGCHSPKSGAVVTLYQALQDSRLNHRVEVTEGILEDKCSELLRSFFSELRKKTC